jgi:Uma2 family endonuclease
MATAEMLELMTAEQFRQRPDPGYPEELVRGRIVAMSVPDRRHGYVCGRAVLIFGSFVDGHDLGRVMSNDSSVVIEQDPDTVRGADVAYYSYARLPKGPVPAGYGPELPELVVEVCSENDRWPGILEKVSEYLNAGVQAVVVLDPEPRVAHVFSAQGPPRMLRAADELTLPDILHGFSVRVGRFFE